MIGDAADLWHNDRAIASLTVAAWRRNKSSDFAPVSETPVTNDNKRRGNNDAGRIMKISWMVQDAVSQA